VGVVDVADRLDLLELMRVSAQPLSGHLKAGVSKQDYRYRNPSLISEVACDQPASQSYSNDSKSVVHEFNDFQVWSLGD
jgi:hypothetical protein